MTQLTPQNTHQSLRSGVLPFIACIQFFLLTGCSKPLEQAVIGMWVDQDHPGEYVVFRPNNTCVMANRSNSANGTWEKIGDDQLRIDLGFNILRFEAIHISGNQMKFSSDGVETRCVRQ